MSDEAHARVRFAAASDHRLEPTTLELKGFAQPAPVMRLGMTVRG
jgi:hypothetical protein